MLLLAAQAHSTFNNPKPSDTADSANAAPAGLVVGHDLPPVPFVAQAILYEYVPM